MCGQCGRTIIASLRHVSSLLFAAGWLLSAAALSRGAEWPFTPLARPETPQVVDAGWGLNPIDKFILTRLHDEGLTPSNRADKRALLRRVTFDLTGLLPTPAEQDAFLADNSPDAYQKVVNRLLGSARYGERWAQHWLDLVRYAETDGFKTDAERPYAYRYRDYVIRALNDDLPYDRFIAQQLAGDELEPDNPEAVIATGLNRLYPDEVQASNLLQRRQEYLDDITEVTGLAFLGLTVGCARCHDHKFDPILQTDYYRLQAFFAPLLPRDDLKLGTEDERQKHDEAQHVWERATADIREKMDQLVRPLREAKFKSLFDPYDDDTKVALTIAAEKRTPTQQQLYVQAMKFLSVKTNYDGTDLEGEELAKWDALAKELAKFDRLKPQPLEGVLASIDAAGPPPATHRLATGNFLKPLEEVQPGFPAFLDTTEPKIAPPARRPESSGRRSALARWLCDPKHPLTARLIVNRMWQHHFGQGIIGTANDFGAMGDPPTHPKLLDWLASELVSRGWHLKEIHRLIVTSATYCQSSDVDPTSAVHVMASKEDPANKLLWHARRKRLEGEAIRDTMLQVAGRLNLRMFGPSALPQLPEGISGRYAWDPDPVVEDRNRRSVYVFAKRNLRYPLMDAFDLPDMHNSCARRTKTTTAPQALTLLNGEFAIEQARYWSGTLLSRYPHQDAELVKAAYTEAYGRQPTAEEIAVGQRFIASQAEVIASGPAGKVDPLLPQPTPLGVPAARAAATMDFCHALMNANEFLYVD